MIVIRVLSMELPLTPQFFSRNFGIQISHKKLGLQFGGS